MSEQTPDPESSLSNYMVELIDWLFQASPPEDMLDRIRQSERLTSRAKRHGYPLGLAKVTWAKRDEIAVWYAKSIAASSRADRIAYVLKNDAIARALDAERLLGSFTWSEVNPFPVAVIDEVAANILHWLRSYGYDLVPIDPIPSSELPNLPLTVVMAFDNQNLTTIRMTPGSRPGLHATPPKIVRYYELLEAHIASREAQRLEEEAQAKEDDIEDEDFSTRYERVREQLEGEGWVDCWFCLTYSPETHQNGICPDCGETWFSDYLQPGIGFTESCGMGECSYGMVPNELHNVLERSRYGIQSGYGTEDGVLRLIDEDDRPAFLAAEYGIQAGGNFSNVLGVFNDSVPQIRHLHSCDLHGSIFEMLDLSGFCLWKTNMERTDCREVNFDKAHAQHASFAGADLTGSSIEKITSLNECDLRGAIGLTSEQKRICKEKGALVDD